MDIFGWIRHLLKDKQCVNIFELGSHFCEDTSNIRSSANGTKKFGETNIWCWECDPRNIEVIKNSPIYKYGEINLVEYAVSDHDGKSTFYQSSSAEEWTGSGSLLEPKDHLKHLPHITFPTKIEVATKTLDTFVQENSIDHIDLIWADLQSAELKMIMGGQKALSKCKYLYSEYYSEEMYSGGVDLQSWMKALPGEKPWRILVQWPNDVLLENVNYNG